MNKYTTILFAENEFFLFKKYLIPHGENHLYSTVKQSYIYKKKVSPRTYVKSVNR